MSNKCELILNKGVVTGNTVSHSNRHIKRRFYPNLQEVALKSEALGVNVTLKVAAATLRTINNKYGDLDGFLLHYRFAKMTDTAKSLRQKVKKALATKAANK